MKAKSTSVLISALILVGAVALFMWWAKNDPANQAGKVANALRQANATMYIVSDDPSSQSQLNEFGQFAKDLPLVDCKVDTSVCDKQQLSIMPALVFKDQGVEITGVQTLDELQKVLVNMGLW